MSALFALRQRCAGLLRAGMIPAGLALVGLALAGCSKTADVAAEQEAGALAAARAYVDAIADLDFETADAMTDPTVFGSGEAMDIRAALPHAQDPISAPWLSVVGPADSSPHPSHVEYVVDVSYLVRDLTGGGRITVQLKQDAEPAAIENWTITEPLIDDAPTYSDLKAANLGGITLRYGGSSHRAVAGYPGGYLLESVEGVKGVDALWIPVGVATAGPWDDDLPILGEK